jgi:hypothetical protein
MNTSIIRAAVAALALATASVGYADDSAEPPAHATKTTDHADPTAKTLPSHASATAQANAFGQQGARERAAHAAAASAAVDAANDSDASTRGADAAAAHSKGHAQGPASQAARGQATAAAARASHGASAAHGAH